MFTSSSTYQNGFDYSKNYFLNALTSKKSNLGGCTYCPFGVELYNRNFVRDSTLKSGGNSQTTADTVEIYKNDFDNLPATNNPYLSTEVTLNANLSNTSWTNSTGSFTNYNASGSGSGKSIAITSASTDTAFLTLSLNVDSGYKLALTSYSFAHRSSSTGYTNYKLITNGIEIGNGSIHVASSGSTLQSTGVVNVLSPVAEKTGTINIILKLFGGSHGSTGSFRMDNFVLNGSVQQQSNGNSSSNYIASKNQYRYGFQGQEHDPEVLDYVWETTSWDSITDTIQKPVLSFDGTGDYVSVPNTTDLNFGTGDFTIEATIKVPTNLVSNYNAFISKRPGAAYSGYFIGVRNNGQVWSQIGGNRVTSSCTNLKDNKWHHIAVRRKSGQVTIWVDGIACYTFTTNFNINNTAGLKIGWDGAYEITTKFKGSIKDVKQWNIARDSASIVNSVNERILGNEYGLLLYFPLNEGIGQYTYDKTWRNRVGTFGTASTADNKDPYWSTQQIIDTNLIATDSILVPNRAFASYKYRGEDTRLGRFFAIDPLHASFPWNSTYAFSENRVIDAIELEGAESRKVKHLQMGTINMGIRVEKTKAQLKAVKNTELKKQLEEKLNNQQELYTRFALALYKEIKDEKYRRELTEAIRTRIDAVHNALSDAGHYALDGLGFVPFLGEIADGVNVVWYMAEGDYVSAGLSTAAMVPFLGWGATGAKYAIKLSKEGVQNALKNTSRLQHGFSKHAKDIKQFADKQWNNATKELWKEFNEDILTNATKTFDNTLGKDKVKGFYKKVNGQDIATYIYVNGKNKGEIATTVVLNKKQMEIFGLK